MSEVLCVSALNEVEYTALGIFYDGVCRALLAVGCVGYVRADLNELTEQALLLYYCGIVLDIEGVRYGLTERFYIVLSAGFAVYSLCNEHIYERYDVYLAVCEEELVHSREYLGVLGEIKV